MRSGGWGPRIGDLIEFLAYSGLRITKPLPDNNSKSHRTPGKPHKWAPDEFHKYIAGVVIEVKADAITGELEVSVKEPLAQTAKPLTNSHKTTLVALCNLRMKKMTDPLCKRTFVKLLFRHRSGNDNFLDITGLFDSRARPLQNADLFDWKRTAKGYVNIWVPQFDCKLNENMLSGADQFLAGSMGRA